MQTLKGVGANIIYCEEAAYMDLGVFYEVIVPLLEVENTGLICISTPLGPWNFYSELIDLKDNKGQQVFNVIRVGMACHRCKNTERETDCTHPSSDRPDWKPEETYDKVRAIMGDKKTLLERELRGQIAEDGNTAFETAHLRRFFERPAAEEPHTLVESIYLAVDPNGFNDGSESGSQSAVVSFFYQRGEIVVSL